MSTEGAIFLQEKPIYYRWIDKPASQVERTESTKLLENLYQKQQAFQKILNWHFLKQINHSF